MNTPPQPLNQMSKPTATVILVVIVVIILGVGAYLLFFGENEANSNNSSASENSNSSVIVNSVTNASIITNDGSNKVLENDTSSVELTFPDDWILTEDAVVDIGHIIKLTKGKVQPGEPYNNDGVIEIEVLKKEKVKNYDWPQGIGGKASTAEITLRNKKVEERITESTNPTAFPDNTIPQLAAGIATEVGQRIIIASLYTGGNDRWNFLTEFENIVSTLQY